MENRPWINNRECTIIRERRVLTNDNPKHDEIAANGDDKHDTEDCRPGKVCQLSHAVGCDCRRFISLPVRPIAANIWVQSGEDFVPGT